MALFALLRFFVPLMLEPRHEGFNFLGDDHNPFSTGMLETTLSKEKMMALCFKRVDGTMLKGRPLGEESDSSEDLSGKFIDNQCHCLIYVHLLPKV